MFRRPIGTGWLRSAGRETPTAGSEPEVSGRDKSSDRMAWSLSQDVQFPILYFKFDGGFWGATEDQLPLSTGGKLSLRSRNGPSEGAGV